MKPKTRVRIIFFCLTISAIGLPLILISTPSIHQHFEPENIAISFVENLSNANFQEAKKLSTPESAETLYLFETLVGNQSDELKNTPTHFNISYSEMNTSQDTLFVQGKLFFSHKHKLIRWLTVEETGWSIVVTILFSDIHGTNRTNRAIPLLKSYSSY